MVIKETPVTRKRGAHVGEFPHRQLEAIVRYLHRIVRPLPKVQSAGRRAATETVLRGARNSAGIMKQEARSHSKEPKNAIVSALRLVVKSAKSVRRFARQLDALTQCRAPHHDAMKPGA